MARGFNDKSIGGAVAFALVAVLIPLSVRGDDKTLVIARNHEPEKLDMAVNGAITPRVMVNVAEKLVDLDGDGKFAPGLGTWERSPSPFICAGESNSIPVTRQVAGKGDPGLGRADALCQLLRSDHSAILRVASSSPFSTYRNPDFDQRVAQAL